MAKPMPTLPPDGEKMAVLTPTTSPLVVEGRAARIAAIDRRVDLQEIVIGAGADVAAARRDDAGRDRAAEAEGIADGDHPVADARRLVARTARKDRSPSSLIFSSARSVFLSAPITLAGTVLPPSSVTVTSVAFSTTWLLVTT